MNAILKAFLQSAETIASAAVPGGAAVDAGIHAVINAKTGLDREVAIMQSAIAGLQLVETDLGVSFATEPDFQAGMLQANAGVLLMVKAIQAKQSAAKANPTPAL